ncbi:Rv1678 family membrane protein [Agromyces mangrovi Wang et al. 2018]|uniref:Rv1678 family membrane protein n=1 Tax=Agromyces mangrovi TaxID=1858653 RepID=UPI0025737A9D|nr:hypothetical protein [Agromyces mangrovi]BDZ65325.1 hypothetical protein GCM10025877_22630 [Agromyces mangrovi]
MSDAEFARAQLPRLDRAAAVLGAASALVALYVFGAGLPTEAQFVRVGLWGAVVLVVFGVLAVLGGEFHRPALTWIAGAGLTLAALVQLATLHLAPGLLGRDASAMAAFGGFGIGLLAVALARRSLRDPETPDPGASDRTT